MSNRYAFLILILLVPAFAFGAVFGSKSLIHVQKASTLDPGRLELRSNLNFYTKVGDFLGQQKPANFSSVNYWDVQGNTLLTYGIVDHFDATVMVRVYQDLNRVKESNTPDDIFIDLKAGGFALAENKVNLGGIFSMRIPTGDIHNYPFEPYSAGKFEFGFTGLFSYFNDPFIHSRDLSFHLNLGWYYHNDAGATLITLGNQAFKAGNNASEFQYGAALTYPTELFDLNLEIWGTAFINKPDSMAFSREDFLYVTPSVRFKPRWWVNFDLGVDLRLSSNNDESASILPDFDRRGLNLPNYFGWKVQLTASVALTPGKSIVEEGIPRKAGVREKVDYFENLLKRERARSLEEELERLKRERQQAEKELEQLRQLLEEEGGGEQ